MSGASERANGRASGPVLTSPYLFVSDHSATLFYLQQPQFLHGGLGRFGNGGDFVSTRTRLSVHGRRRHQRTPDTSVLVRLCACKREGEIERERERERERGRERFTINQATTTTTTTKITTTTTTKQTDNNNKTKENYKECTNNNRNKYRGGT